MKVLFQTPQDIRNQIWKELARASQDRHHAWRTPVLATTDDDGQPNARTVVLRKVLQATHAFQLYTDSRSQKVNELNQRQHAYFVFWSARLNWQLRVKATIEVQTSGADVEAQWQVVKQSKSAGDYLGTEAPGTSLVEHDACELNATPNLGQQHYFAVLTAHVVQMDWLELGGDHHRRATFTSETWEWLKP